jgi:general secretion pathway protein N
VAWQLVPARLAEGRAAFNVQLDCPDAQASAQLLRGWSEWEVRTGTAQVAARALPVFFPLVAAWRPDGMLYASADGVRWNEREIHGPLWLEWRDASVALSDVRPLGVYRIAAEGMGDAAKLTLTTASGALQLEGRGEVKVAQGATFSGEARAEALSAAALEPLLKVMGPRRPDGARSIEVRIR